MSTFACAKFFFTVHFLLIFISNSLRSTNATLYRHVPRRTRTETRMRVQLRCDAVSVASAVTGHGWTTGHTRLGAAHQVDTRNWTRPTKWTRAIGRGPTSLSYFYYLFKKCLPNTKTVLLRLLLAVSRKRTKRLHCCTSLPPFRHAGRPLFLFSSAPCFFFQFFSLSFLVSS